MTELSDEVLLSKAEKSVKKGNRFKVPQLIVLMGLPGSGKSYASSYLHEKYGYTVLSGENITYAIYGTEKCSGSEYALAYKTLRKLAIKLISQGLSLVIDGTNLRKIFRQQIYDEVRCDETKLIYLKIDDQTALKRVAQRGVDCKDRQEIKSGCPIETFNSFKNQLEEPSADENPIMLISDENIFNNIDLLMK